MVTLEEVAFNAPLGGIKRSPKSDSDFGDIDTVGLCVKKIGKQFFDYRDHDFGIFLGFYKEQYHIGTRALTNFKPTKLVSFDTLTDLKKVWMLD